VTDIEIHGRVALNELYNLYRALFAAGRRTEADKLMICYHEVRDIVLSIPTGETEVTTEPAPKPQP